MAQVSQAIKQPVSLSRAVTPRAIALGLAGIVGVVFFIHWAEIIVSARGHSALANTSIPVGAFDALLVLMFLSGLLRHVRRAWGLSEGELAVIYAMMAVATVLASSGAMHFLIPALASPYYFASPENKWEVLFHRYLPSWICPPDSPLLRRFFDGGPIPVNLWLGPSLVWSAFLFAFAFCTLCAAALLRRQWIERERLTFPTVNVVLEVTSSRASFWCSPAAWIGMAIPFAIGTLNTIAVNYPTVPRLEVRHIDISSAFRGAPWNAIGGLSLSFYPFVVGVAYLLSREVTFSCWFFFLFEKAQRVLGAVFGLENWGRGGLSRFPFDQHQGAGAFLALTAVALWIGRSELAALFRSGLGLRRASDNAAGPRWPAPGFLVSFIALVVFGRAAGMNPVLATVLLLLSLAYLTAATRIRAETGDAWLFGPLVDPQTLITTALGTRALRPQDLTAMAYLSVVTTFDLRCTSMPHQLDAYKLAEVREIPPGKLSAVLVAALAIGIPVAFWVGLWVWHHIGALAGDAWRLAMGRRPFEILGSYLQMPTPADLPALGFVAGGFLVTVALAVLRSKLTAWPFHPVGYAVAGTISMGNQWFPFLIAWACKSLVLRYGGPKLYRR
ncbi:MAG: hypothetical protein N2512_08635, partial [Armatimonadetes bacterium]|nr:hypothetical protein [Armatimonadota bacterium]